LDEINNAEDARKWSSSTGAIAGDARQRALSRWHPLRALNAAVVRVMATDLLTVRVDLAS